MTDREVRKRADAVHSALNDLVLHPGRGAFEDLVAMPGRRYRRWIVGEIKIIYYTTKTIVRVTDIFDCRQDPRKMKG